MLLARLKGVTAAWLCFAAAALALRGHMLADTPKCSRFRCASSVWGRRAGATLPPRSPRRVPVVLEISETADAPNPAGIGISDGVDLRVGATRQALRWGRGPTLIHFEAGGPAGAASSVPR